MIEIKCANHFLLSRVLANLREADREELEACGADLKRMPDAILQRRVFAFCALDSHYGPVAAWGMLHTRANVGAGFAFGTDQWGRALMPVVRQIRTFVLPFLRENGFHRVEALAMAHRHDVARFMALIGARAEGTLREYGVNGEDFISYRWLANEYRGERYPASTVCSHTAH
jgi:hypothetical protein